MTDFWAAPLILAAVEDVADDERSLEAWYESTQATIGASEVRSYVRNDVQVDANDPMRHLLLYSVEGAERELKVASEGLRRLLTDYCAEVGARCGGPWVFVPRGTPAMAPREVLLYVVLSNANEGRELAFNLWYDRYHMPEVVANVPAFVSGRRYEQGTDEWQVHPSPWCYLALYQIAEPDFAASLTAIEEVVARRGFTSSRGSLARDYAVWVYRAVDTTAV